MNMRVNFKDALCYGNDEARTLEDFQQVWESLGNPINLHTAWRDSNGGWRRWLFFWDAKDRIHGVHLIPYRDCVEEDSLSVLRSLIRKAHQNDLRYPECFVAETRRL